MKDVIVESPDMPEPPAKPGKDKKTEKPKKSVSPEQVGPDDSAESFDKLTLLVPGDLSDRLYGEVFHDPDRRWMKDILVEILREGLKHRPDPGKAPARFIADMKSRGKRKKS